MSGPKHAESHLSLCMIVKNESRALADCIRSIRTVVDEIIVVDTGSTDGTKGVAQQFGARVFDVPWEDDFSAARNASILRATGEYILWLDADDLIDDSEIRKLHLLKKKLPRNKRQAYHLLVQNESPVDGETRFFQLRIFPRIGGAFFEGRVHEQIIYPLGRLGIEMVQTDIVIRHVGYGSKAIAAQKMARNLRIIQKELESDPDNLILRYNAAKTLAGMNRQEEAIALLEKIIANGDLRRKEKDVFLEISLNVGRYYVELKRFEDARTVFQTLIYGFPNNGLAHFSLAETLFLMKDFSAAREELEKSLMFPAETSLFPLNAGKYKFYQYYYLGECYAQLGEPKRAEEMFCQSLGLHKDDYRSYDGLGRLSFQARRFEEAVNYFQQALSQGGMSDTIFTNLGIAFWKMGGPKEAEKSLFRSLDINPRRWEAMITLGQIYRQEKQYENGVAILRRALAVNPDLIEARLAISDLFFRLHDIDQLVEECDVLLTRFNLPRDFTINSFEDLAYLYGLIGDHLADSNRKEISIQAYQVSFLLFPSRNWIEKIVGLTGAAGFAQDFLPQIAESLSFHGRTIEDLGGKSHPSSLMNPS